MSHLPIFSLSDDNNFATLEWDALKNKNTHLRFSLINIMLGDILLYCLTFDIKNKKLKLLHVLKLDELEGMSITSEKMEEVSNRYKEHIDNISADDMEIEKEKLLYHIQNEEQRIESSIGKINIYAIIILTVIPLVLALIDLKKIFTFPLGLQIGIGILSYSLLNICAYVFRTIKVRGIYKSTFGDLRASTDKKKEILVQYQYDWQQLKYKAQLFVSFVLNLQEWVILVLALTVFLAVNISSYNAYPEKVQENKIECEQVKPLKLDEINDPYTYSSIEWQEIMCNIEKKNISRLILITNLETDVPLLVILDKYADLDYQILRDKTMKADQLKIIEEK